MEKIPLKRLVPSLIIGPASWLGPYIVCTSLFLPTMIQELDSANKVNLVALFSTCAMIAASISNMVAGSLSDRTTSKYGKRTPWIVGGAFFFMLCMIGASFAPNIPVLLVVWILGQIALNFIVAPMVAWIDMAPENSGGTASSAYGGLGMALGNNGFTVLGAYFLGQYRLGFIVFGIVAFVGTLLAVFIVKEPSNESDKIVKDTSTKEKLFLNEVKVLFPKWSVGRDYYLALIGKVLQGIANFMITGYLLYIMTDFLNQSSSQTQNMIQKLNVIMLIFGILCGLLAGPLSDKFNVLKIPVALSAIFLGIGALAIYFLQSDVSIVIYGFMAGLGMGIWNSLDGLLNLKIIPDRNRVAFFLGVYNLGASVTQAIAPVLAAIIISLFGFQSIFLVSFVFAMISGVCIILIKQVKS